jgi:DNA helicase-2/ATP-dependent DNA helicase PcrA
VSARRPLSGNETVRAIFAALEAMAIDTPLDDALRYVAKSASFGASVVSEALRGLTELADQCGGDRARFLEAVALADESDFFDPRADRVALLTMHAAKGLEFAIVFVVGLEDGIVPLRFGAFDEADVAEERRLFYVAMTRAKDRLVPTRAEERSWRGKRRRLSASPFLADIEAELLRDMARPLPRRRPELAQLSLF